MTPKPALIDLDEMVREFRPKVGFKVRHAIGARNSDWEDVTNEILSQTVDKIRAGEFRGECSVGTFIYTITLRRITDYIRQKTRVLRFAPEPAPAPPPGAEAERKEELERMVEALGTLKPKYKDVLRLYCLMECTREETARRLGISPAKVSERVNYAHKLLRRQMGR